MTFDQQPKYGHLKKLHAAVNLCSDTLLYGTQTIISLGALQQAYVYKRETNECAAFLVNTDGAYDANVQFQNQTYKIPQKSISILPDCKTEAFNTAKVSSKESIRTRTPIVKANRYLTYYLWYTTSYEQSEEQSTTIRVNSRGHVLRAFVNGEFIGVNDISMLSIMIGLPDSGAYMESRASGLENVRIGEKDLSNLSWGYHYQVGFKGEMLQVYTKHGSRKAKWNKFASSSQPFKWYKGNDPVAVNLGSMGKGEVWINGESIGRYWISFLNPQGSPSQIWYHIPRSFLKPRDNLLVMFEEEGGNPLGISVDTVSVAMT
ncbi:beta-galactosidase 16-like [Salvia divinorum]|uniref:beta-galactosidase n=1 Tax=Salvia divinorum TaxID=28513 RepID=A0ABD1GII3_SALDI